MAPPEHASINRPTTRATRANATDHNVAQSCYSVIGDKPFLWSKPKVDPP